MCLQKYGPVLNTVPGTEVAPEVGGGWWTAEGQPLQHVLRPVASASQFRWIRLPLIFPKKEVTVIGGDSTWGLTLAVAHWGWLAHLEFSTVTLLKIIVSASAE